MVRKIEDMTLRELETFSASLNEDLRELAKSRTKKVAALDDVQKLIARKKMAAVEPVCSDHALLRFIERSKGLNVEAVRKEIMSPIVVSAINAGACSITVGGVKLKVREKTVTTVFD